MSKHGDEITKAPEVTHQEFVESPAVASGTTATGRSNKKYRAQDDAIDILAEVGGYVEYTIDEDKSVLRKIDIRVCSKRADIDGLQSNVADSSPDVPHLLAGPPRQVRSVLRRSFQPPKRDAPRGRAIQLAHEHHLPRAACRAAHFGICSGASAARQMGHIQRVLL